MVDLKRLEVQARDGPADPNALAKWRILNRLHDRNETMYYKVAYFAFILLFLMYIIARIDIYFFLFLFKNIINFIF